MIKKLSFAERALLSSNPTAQQLFRIMEEKKSNLALSADFTSGNELLACAKALGPELCILKTHIDIVEDFSPDLISSLLRIARQEQFLLFEDRKFADIGNTVAWQYGKGIYKIAEWADLTNAHVIPGPGVIAGLKKIGQPLGRGLLLLAEMSSEGTLTDRAYAERAVEMAVQFSDFVIGFISQRQLLSDPRFLFLTPGIHLHESQDALGQTYRTPDTAMASGADILIVGRAIYNAPDPKKEACLYRNAGWKCYVSRLS
jgi:orotidine 5'-phosphate decarboxylase subfamily 1